MKTEEIVKKDTLTEAEVLLLKRRLNDGKTTINAIFGNEGKTFKLTAEQNEKGIKWLLNEWKTPRGIERKNNPFGIREQEIISNFSHFVLMEFYDTANNYRAQVGIKNFLPLYRIYSKDNNHFEYYVNYKGINIIG